MPLFRRRSVSEEAVYQRLHNEKVIKDASAELIDVRIVKQKGEKFLTLFCDVKEKGIGFALLEQISLALEPIIDNEFPEIDPDYFEVSSPGAERVLTSPEEFNFYAGETVAIKFYAKEEGLEKQIEALLLGVENNQITFSYRDHKFFFPPEKIASVRRVIV